MSFLEHLETRKKEVRAIIDLASKEDAALDLLIALQKQTATTSTFEPSKQSIQKEDLALPTEDQPIFYKEEAMAFVGGITGNFKIADFKNFLLKKYDENQINDQSMRGPLAKMAKSGEIFIVRKGIGKAPVIYSTINPSLPGASDDWDGDV
jgi:hypothetical protein